LARKVALDDGCDGGFDDGDVGCGLGLCSQFGDEAAVVEGASFGCFRGPGGDEVIGVGNVDLLFAVEDLVAVAGYRVDVVEAIWGLLSAFHPRRVLEMFQRTPHAQLLQSIDTTGL
jgi:hypothetical protein